MTFEIVTTRDGHRAVRDRASGELMHPLGPIVEAEALYIGPSHLERRLSQGAVTVFDVGLGAATNAALSLRAARTAAAGLRLFSFDRTLDAMALALDDEGEFGFDAASRGAARAVIEDGSFRSATVTWRAILGDLPETLARAEARADVVFWDPYSPDTNPNLWTVAAFTALRAVCNPQATVHTYGAATATRAAMLLAGFVVGRGPAIGRKSETTIAAVDAKDLDDPLDGRWLARLERSSKPLPSDAAPDAIERIRAVLSGR